MNTNKIRSWCTVDEKGNIVALCASREDARKQKNMQQNMDGSNV
jgi:hypothetical protein